MDSKRKHVKSQASGESSGDSSCDSPTSLCSNSAATSQTPLSGGNAFANDGSFMEIFKKKMEEEQRKTEMGHKGGDGSRHGQTTMAKKPPPVTNFVGKRRGGVFLKTGVVAKKQKNITEVEPDKGDAWSKYMAEVKKYKAHQCGDDDKTRPLVK
ncbi:hypothetical protein fugu_015757 [Takifugu bimaculatus]|uniref:Telomerase RNA component interacting RNase n=1 Tax=Takifugu bimaculatus TaxID=433685 RepID=A0A4Z2BZK4_9TELE|nr:hypothetical protein fugu_015757 [Takifugu bimaculatus]